MYNYRTAREKLFTEEGQVMFLKIRDYVKYMLKLAGAVRMEEAIAKCSGDAWEKIACVDRMVELGELQEMPQGDVFGQHRVFVEGRRRGI